MRARIKSKKLRATILAGSLALAFGPFVPKALAQTDTSIVIDSRVRGSAAIAARIAEAVMATRFRTYDATPKPSGAKSALQPDPRVLPATHIAPDIATC